MINASWDRALLDSPLEPFADAVVRLDVQRDPACHVETLHGPVRAALRRAIGEVGASGRASLLLVHGDPGQGKTHELAHLRAEARDYYFLEIPPLKDPTTPFQHVLRYAVQTLIARKEIDRFLWSALRRVTTSVVDAAREEGDDELVKQLAPLLEGRDHFVETFQALARQQPALGVVLGRRGALLPPLSEVDPEVARVLCRIADRDAEAAARSWLRAAELPDEELALLGVRQSLDSEDRCFRALAALARLSQRPLVLCFDQLEATRDLLGTPGVLALFSAVMEVYQQLPVCLVLMCQTQVWADVRPLVPQAALERMGRPLSLAPPTALEAIGLIEGRMEPLWRSAHVSPPYASYPFAKEWVTGFVDEVVPSVRRVVQECAARLGEMRARARVVELSAGGTTQPLPPSRHDPLVALAAEHRRQCEVVRASDDLSQPVMRQQRLRSALERWLRACLAAGRAVAGAQVIDVQSPTRARGPRPPMLLTLTLDGDRRTRVALEVHSDDARSAYAVVERLHHQVCSGDADVGVLLRESAALLKPTAARTLELARTLEPRGGIVYLDEEPALRLVAAELLLDAVSANEVWAGDREVTSEEALTWLTSHAALDAALAPIVSRLR